jgi:diguanylate cyclase (GGDEF)-like protein
LLALHCGWLAAHPTIEDLQSLRESDPGGLLQRLDRELGEADPDGEPRYLAYQFRLRAEMLLQRGEIARARADADSFLQRAQALGEPLLISRALVLQATLDAAQGKLESALERFEAARRQLENAQQPIELARTHLAIAAAQDSGGNHTTALLHYQQALALTRSAGETALEALALAGLARATRLVDGPEAGLALHQQALQLARQRGDVAAAAHQQAAICEAQVQAGQLEAAQATCRDALEQAQRLDLEGPQARLELALGDLSRQRGDLGAAVRHYNAAMARPQRAVNANVELLAQLAQVHDHYGGSESPPGAPAPNANALKVRELEQTLQSEREQHRLALAGLGADRERSRQFQYVLITLAAAIVLLFAGIGAVSLRRGYRAKATLQRRLASRDEVLEQARQQIDELAPVDGLTGLVHRRQFESLVGREITRARRSGQALTLAIVNIEDFAAMSAQFGQQAGDEVLKEVARQLHFNLREADLVCRWKDAEFLCVLPDNDIASAELTMQRVRQRLAGQPLLVWGDSLPITLGFGIARLEQDIEDAVRIAEGALRAADLRSSEAGVDRARAAGGDVTPRKRAASADSLSEAGAERG